MQVHEQSTSWLELIGDRAAIGRSIVRLSRLAAAAHQHRHAMEASANGLAGSAADRLVNVAPRGAVAHKEVAR